MGPGSGARVTFCFTDLVGSTALARRLGDEDYAAVLEQHRGVIRRALAQHGGTEVLAEGDGLFLTFDDPVAAIEFGWTVQREIEATSWPANVDLHVRVGMHTGTARRREDGDWVGLAVHQAARVADAAMGGQVLLTAHTAAAAERPYPDGLEVARLGRYLVRDFDGGVELFEVRAEGLRAGAAPRARRSGAGLPLPQTAMVGRRRELDTLLALMTEGPLVTLVGMGGVGKTRLALEWAAASASLFPDGLHLAELSPLTGPGLVAGTIANAAGVRPLPGQEPLDAVAARIGDGRRLLVLDSCERVLDGVAGASEQLLRACPALCIVATSTEPVRIPDERVLTIAPLPPADAVTLLRDRARAMGADLGDSAETAHALDEIATRLDGIPLALELAAGRMADLGVDEVVRGLDNRFALLTNGYRTALSRHRTLEAAVAWTVDLLKPSERELLARLAFLQGRWQPADALAVCDQPDRTALDGLVRRALLVEEPGPPARIRMLDTVRAFAAGLLDDDARRRLAGRRASGLLDTLMRATTGPEEQYLQELGALLPDVRTVMAGDFDEEVALRAQLGSIAYLWYEAKGPLQEGVPLLEAVLADKPPTADLRNLQASLGALVMMLGDLPRVRELADALLGDPSTPPRARAMALLFVNPMGAPAPADGPDPLEEVIRLAGAQSPLGIEARSRLALRLQLAGQAEEAGRQLEALVDDASAIGVDSVAIQAKSRLGGALIWSRRFEEARRLLEEARAEALALDLPILVAACVTNLGVLAMHEGDLEQAGELAEQRLELARRTGDARSMATALGLISTAAAATGDVDRARSAMEEAYEQWSALGAADGVVINAFNLVALNQSTGDRDAAAAWAQRLVLAGRAPEAAPLLRLVLFGVGAWAAADGRDEGVALLAAARAQESSPLPLDPSDEAWFDACLGAATEALGPDAVALAGVRGGAMDLDAALALAARVASRD